MVEGESLGTQPATDDDEFRVLRGFQELMQRRVRRILLVSTLYDSFILTEDGQLNEALLNQFVDLNLSHNPDVSRVGSGAEAVQLLAEHGHYDLVISSIQLGDMDAAELAVRMRAADIQVPLVVLAYNNRELTEFNATHPEFGARVFMWQGDVRILLAIVKHVEDRWNVEHDTGRLGVPAIIVVEDNVRYYSSFLPTIYAELVEHTHQLLSEGLNLSHKMLRMRARPKVLLCDTFEEAWSFFQRFEEQTIGVISDIEFPRAGRLDPGAGIELARRVADVRPDVRLVLQSSQPANEATAQRLGASFLLKGSPTLLSDLREILVQRFGFGEFVFRMPGGQIIDRARDLRSLLEKLRTVPQDSIDYHARRNHFSNWLKARTEFELAERLRPRKVEDFATKEALRAHLLEQISDYRLHRNQTVIVDFDWQEVAAGARIVRIGGGSLGGKARGMAFVNRLLKEGQIARRFPEVQTTVPPAVVLGTDIFDEFLSRNRLRDLALRSDSDAELIAAFEDAQFPRDATYDLRAYLQVARYPLAVRSSGLLEDSLSQPFAGVYQTFMLPNNERDVEKRLAALVRAVKRVYASTFSRQAKTFSLLTAKRLEEEKMAVIIQKIVGRQHGARFYPDFSGVGRSRNHYPQPPLNAEDGVVALALGMGRAVVDGDCGVRFSPKHPSLPFGFSSPEEALTNAQRNFFALPLEPGDDPAASDSDLVRYPIKIAEEDGTLHQVASTYVHQNQAIYEGTSRRGTRLVTFAPILKRPHCVLAELLGYLLDAGSEGTRSPVEIEFAGNLETSSEPAEFGFLQLRPLSEPEEREDVEIGAIADAALVCRSGAVLGNGVVRNIFDAVVVDAERFDRLRSREVAEQVARLNATLVGEHRPYLLVGVGRWGSADPHLGIPVRWTQIAGARVIVEAGFRDIRVTPSQGSHFFQNLTSLNVGYFTVNPEAGFVDWQWLAGQPALEDTGLVRHLRFGTPAIVTISGRSGVGIIQKPEAGS